MKNILSIILLILVVPITLLAQEKKIDFFGAGRFSLNNSSLGGKLLEQDTTTARKQMTGYSLFDMGFHIRPNSETEIKAITRVQNDINGFWGAGINFYLRELYLRGLMFNKIKYQVGDLNTKLTPYTLYNNFGELNQFNPEALNLFTEVIRYDNFYGDNSWRQQGATANMDIKAEKYLDNLHLNGLITKNRQTDFFSSPDRLFAAANVKADFFNQLALTYYYVNTFDVKNSAMFNNGLFNNSVNSFGVNEKLQYKKYQFNLSADLGNSAVNYVEIDNAPNALKGNFTDFGFAINDNKTWNATLNYRMVETNFRSVGAQSRRVDFNRVAKEYAYYTNREEIRPYNMLDIITDGNYYNMFLSPVLNNYNPALENMLPYGKATPNRQGIDAVVNWHTKNKNLADITVTANKYNEITGQGTTQLRDFTNLSIQAGLGLNQFYGGKRKVHVSMYNRLQNTKRDGVENIDKISLNTNQFKIGVEYEIIPNLELQFAGLLLNANGNEFLPERNSFNEIIFYNGYKVNLNETLLIGGINYQFSKHNALKIQYQHINNNNQLLAQNNYNINRLAVLYNLYF